MPTCCPCPPQCSVVSPVRGVVWLWQKQTSSDPWTSRPGAGCTWGGTGTWVMHLASPKWLLLHDFSMIELQSGAELSEMRKLTTTMESEIMCSLSQKVRTRTFILAFKRSHRSPGGLQAFQLPWFPELWEGGETQGPKFNSTKSI